MLIAPKLPGYSFTYDCEQVEVKLIGPGLYVLKNPSTSARFEAANLMPRDKNYPETAEVKTDSHPVIFSTYIPLKNSLLENNPMSETFC